MSESKNSLFLGISNLKIEKKLASSFTPSDFQLVLECSAFDTFVAKQIDQSSKYFLLQLHELCIQANFQPGTMRVNNSEATLGLVCLAVNENYVLFLASLMEYHMNDMKDLVEFIQVHAASDSTAQSLNNS